MPDSDPLACTEERALRATGIQVAENKDLLAHACQDVYWDDSSNHYWRFFGREASVIRTKEDLKLHLRLRGLSDIAPKGQENSPVDHALGWIQATRRVNGAGPFLYNPKKIVHHMGRPYVNTSMVRPLEPDPGKRAWGEGFQWLSQYQTNLLSDRPEQLDIFQAWVAHFYQQALAGEPLTGMAMILAGPSSIGKNFLGTAVLGQLFGGCRDASSFILGSDQFNSSLSDTPLWTLHDAALSDDRTRDTFSQNLKRVVANRELIVRAMYREGIGLPWNGRILITMNLDPESLRMVPNMEISNLEKLLLLKGSPAGMDRFPTDAEVLKELPFYAAWLRDYKIPDALASERFGLKHWHHPELFEAAQAESGTAGALELLDAFREYLFDGVDPKVKDWRGSATELHALMLDCQTGLGASARMLFRTARSLGMAVSKLETRGVTWIRKERSPAVDRKRYLIIQRPEKA